MALYLKIERSTGPVTGPPHRVGWFFVQSWSWSLERRTDITTGVPTSARNFGPVVLTREVDGGSAVLVEAMVGDRNLGISLGADANVPGEPMPGITYQLKDAKVSSYTVSSTFGGIAACIEEVELLYSDILVTNDPTKASFHDGPGSLP